MWNNEVKMENDISKPEWVNLIVVRRWGYFSYKIQLISKIKWNKMVSGLTLVQVMALSLLGAKPLPGPVLIY